MEVADYSVAASGAGQRRPLQSPLSARQTEPGFHALRCRRG